MAVEPVHELLIRGLDDWLQLAEVVSVVSSAMPTREEAETRSATLETIQQMLARGLIQVGEVTPGGFSAWQLPPDVTLRRIVERGDALGGMPGLGDVCWFSNTTAGDAIARGDREVSPPQSQHRSARPWRPAAPS